MTGRGLSIVSFLVLFVIIVMTGLGYFGSIGT